MFVFPFLFSFVFNSKISVESGRLFVWGENQYCQLSAGSKEVITKPSCVKEIKNLGYKVRNIAFGEAFSVILTGKTKQKKKQPHSKFELQMRFSFSCETLEAVSQSQQTCDQSSILNIQWHYFSPFLLSEFLFSFFWYFLLNTFHGFFTSFVFLFFLLSRLNLHIHRK